jgi:hypothetical protein
MPEESTGKDTAANSATSSADGASILPGGLHPASRGINPLSAEDLNTLGRKSGGLENNSNISQAEQLTIDEQRRKKEQRDEEALRKNIQTIDIIEADAKKLGGRYYLKIGGKHETDIKQDTRVLILSQEDKVNKKFVIFSAQYGRMGISGIGEILKNRIEETEGQREERNNKLLRDNTDIPAEQQKKEGIRKEDKKHILYLFDHASQTLIPYTLDQETPDMATVRSAITQSKEKSEFIQLKKEIELSEKKIKEADEVIDLYNPQSPEEMPPQPTLDPSTILQPAK